ncbi:MAG: hemerythrin cation binding region [Phenylobacterium sp.]|nr:hemerythrin cation binding region [Phenylobacterium sp.]
MPTANTTSGKSGAKRSSAASKSSSTAKKTSSAAAAPKDAIALLKADHRAVEKLFSQFEKAKDEGQKQQTAQQICLELRVHTQIEEEIFYPTSREFLKDDEIVNEAIIEHQAAKDLIDQIEGMDPSDEMYDAKVTVLQEMIEHHVGEEEKEYFPQLQKSDMDLKGVGQQMMMRKEELMSQMGGQVPATH